MGRRLGAFLDTPLLVRRGAAPPSDVDAQEGLRTGILNLFELVHVLVRQGEAQAADAAYELFEPVAEGLTRRRIFEASRLRTRLPDRGLSYADAAGYVTARELGLAFLTTDRAFRGLPGAQVVPR